MEQVAFNFPKHNGITSSNYHSLHVVPGGMWRESSHRPKERRGVFFLFAVPGIHVFVL